MMLQGFLILLAVWTRLELATPCVTGMYSNQLNYQTFFKTRCSSVAVRKDTYNFPNCASIFDTRDDFF